MWFISKETANVRMKKKKKSRDLLDGGCRDCDEVITVWFWSVLGLDSPLRPLTPFFLFTSTNRNNKNSMKENPLRI